MNIKTEIEILQETLNDQYPKAFLEDGTLDLDKLILIYPDSPIAKTIVDYIINEVEQNVLYGSDTQTLHPSTTPTR